MSQPKRPTEQQLKTVEPIDAFGAFLYAMRGLLTPDFLRLQHELPATGFTLQVPGSPTIDLDAALHLIAKLHSCTKNLGQNHRTTELAFSEDGSRMACLDNLELELTAPVALPSGLRLQLHPGQPHRRVLTLRLAHYVRLTEQDGTHKIAEWRISTNLSDFLKLL